MSFSELCDIIILIGAITVAITNIYKFIAKPQEKLKAKRDKEIQEKIDTTLKEKVPEYLKQMEEKLKRERIEERNQILPSFKEEILDVVKEALDGIMQINLEQSRNIETLTQGSKDMMRQRIMDIYYKYRADRKMPIHARETLNELYKDYKAEKGNSYIDKYYSRMSSWEDYEDED